MRPSAATRLWPSRARDEVVANVTDTYYLAAPAPGELTVTKTIAGPAAGQQGASHNLGQLQRYRLTGLRYPGQVRPAGTVLAQLYGDSGRLDLHRDRNGQRRLPASVHVVTDGSPQTVDITANGTAVANITDTYSNATIPLGSLTVTQENNRPRRGPARAL